MKNFSEASEEMLADLKETLDGTADELNANTRALINGISEDLASNLERIRSHGDRADRIVRDMLMLGRGGGSTQAVDINELLSGRAQLAVPQRACARPRLFTWFCGRSSIRTRAQF